jgi:hypothetical protein
VSTKTKKKSRDHGPNCIACNEPEKFRQYVAEDRAALDKQAARAGAHREAGEAAREEHRQAAVGTPEFAETQQRMLYELGAANGLAQGVMMQRAHLDRVVAAHGGER